MPRIPLARFLAGAAAAVFAGLFSAAQVGAQQQKPPQPLSPAAVAAQIGTLERKVVEFEAAERKAPQSQQAVLEYITALAALGPLYLQADRIPDTWPLTDKVAARLEALLGPDAPQLAEPLEARAANLGVQGRYAEADRVRKRALALKEKAYGPESVEVAVTLQGLALLNRQRNRPDEAMSYAKRALAVADKKLGPKDIRRAQMLFELADLHMTAKRYAEAEPLYRQALAISDGNTEAVPAVAQLATLQALQALSTLHYRMGKSVDGKAEMERALAISEQMFGAESSVASTIMGSLAFQLVDAGALDPAEQLFRKALKIAESNSRISMLSAHARTGLALVATHRKDPRAAWAEISRAAEIAVAAERVTTAGSDPTEKQTVPSADVYLLAALTAYRVAEAEPGAAARLLGEAFVLGQRAERSGVAGTLAQMAARVATGTSALSKLVRERQDISAEWQRTDKLLSASSTLPPVVRNADLEKTMRARMDTIELRIANIDRSLVKDFPEFGKLSDPAPLTLTEAQALLKPNEALVFVAHRQNQSLVWAVTRDKADWRLFEVGTEEIAADVLALRCGLDDTAWREDADGGTTCAKALGRSWSEPDPLPFDLARAHRLYENLLVPFAAMTEGRSIILATSGPLANLPLGVLVTAPPAAAADSLAEAAWLVKRNALSTVPSVGSIRALRETAKPSKAKAIYFGLANPLLDGPDASYADLARTAKALTSCAAVRAQTGTAPVMMARKSLSDMTLSAGLAPVDLLRRQTPLPETAEEVCSVAESLGARDDDVRLAGAATETEVKRLSAAGRLASYRILHFSTHGVLGGKVTKAAEPGLVLTPPATATAIDDGFLTASEVAELKLDADWVILSACNTAAGGRSGSEALSGLARAFFYAQARALVVSQWEVDSEASAALVTAAASAIAKEPGIGRAEALRRAITSVAAGSPHPSYWAPFVLVGDGG